jgi:hypothetical protein
VFSFLSPFIAAEKILTADKWAADGDLGFFKRLFDAHALT